MSTVGWWLSCYIDLRVALTSKWLKRTKCSLWSHTEGLHIGFTGRLYKVLLCGTHRLPRQLRRTNKGGVHPFIWHMSTVKPKQKSAHRFHTSPDCNLLHCSCKVFPRWTLVYFWSTSSSRGVTYEVTSCLFWSDLRERLQMLRLRGRVSHEEIARASSFALFGVSQGFCRRLNTSSCRLPFPTRWHEWSDQNILRRPFISELCNEPAICTRAL